MSGEIEELSIQAGQWGSPSDPIPYRWLAADYFELACRAPEGSAERREARERALSACRAVHERGWGPAPPLPRGCPAQK